MFDRRNTTEHMEITDPIGLRDAGLALDLTDGVIGAAMAVHRELGPGLLESAYESRIPHDFKASGIDFRAQVPLPVSHRGIRVGSGFRPDLIAGDRVIVELKAVESLTRPRGPRGPVDDLPAPERAPGWAADQLQHPGAQARDQATRSLTTSSPFLCPLCSQWLPQVRP